jgi:hypothetical protein
MTEGVLFAKRSDPVSSGMAISLFQDSVEMFIWALIKERGIIVKETSSFTANIESLQKAGVGIAHTAKLFELNKARVGFKHYGNLPAADEAGKFQAYVEDFLRTSFKDHFTQDYDELSLIDLVSFSEVRERLKKADALLASEEFEKSAMEAGVAKAMLFGRLDRFIPRVDRNLRDMDSLLSQVPEIRGARTFQYLTDYLELLRETSLATLLRLPLQDYTFVRTQLPAASQFANGEWRTHGALRRRYDAATCRRAIACLVDISIRMESLV